MSEHDDERPLPDRDRDEQIAEARAEADLVLTEHYATAELERVVDAARREHRRTYLDGPAGDHAGWCAKCGGGVNSWPCKAIEAIDDLTAALNAPPEIFSLVGDDRDLAITSYLAGLMSGFNLTSASPDVCIEAAKAVRTGLRMQNLEITTIEPGQ